MNADPKSASRTSGTQSSPTAATKKQQKSNNKTRGNHTGQRGNLHTRSQVYFTTWSDPTEGTPGRGWRAMFPHKTIEPTADRLKIKTTTTYIVISAHARMTTAPESTRHHPLTNDTNNVVVKHDNHNRHNNTVHPNQNQPKSNCLHQTNASLLLLLLPSSLT